MKNSKYALVVVLTSLLILMILYYFNIDRVDKSTFIPTEEAIEVVKKTDSTLADYPQEKEPRRKIIATNFESKVYLAFAELKGNKMEIKCFSVTREKEVITNGVKTFEDKKFEDVRPVSCLVK